MGVSKVHFNKRDERFRRPLLVYSTKDTTNGQLRFVYSLSYEIKKGMGYTFSGPVQTKTLNYVQNAKSQSWRTMSASLQKLSVMRIQCFSESNTVVGCF